MFDISWSEFLLIGVVALVVIGPKELPTVMRTLGQWTRKVRSMASEFQNQFHEALREAEMTDLKKQVDDMARDVKDSVTGLDPLKDVRADVTGIGEDVKRTLSATPPADAAVPVAEAATAPAQAAVETLPVETLPAETLPAALESAVTPEAETPAPPPQTASEQAPRESEVAGAGAEAAAPQPHDKAVETDPAGRAG
ncbi:MAG TPA: Sec-independent protein translocase protein TatB [Xanthobacteraceae bacterium]|nr:Sec-independent protein translocase protein TatB [Xanthobacteraceae bacterium]